MGAAVVIAFEEVRARKQWATLRQHLHVAAHNHPEAGPQTKALVGPHSLQTCGTSDPQ